MTVKLRISGQRDERDLGAMRGGPPGAERGAPVTDLFEAVEVVESFNLSPSARARTEALGQRHPRRERLDWDMFGTRSWSRRYTVTPVSG